MFALPITDLSHTELAAVVSTQCPGYKLLIKAWDSESIPGIKIGKVRRCVFRIETCVDHSFFFKKCNTIFFPHLLLASQCSGYKHMLTCNVPDTNIAYASQCSGYKQMLNASQCSGYKHMLNASQCSVYKHMLNVSQYSGYKHMLNASQCFGYKHMLACDVSQYSGY